MGVAPSVNPGKLSRRCTAARASAAAAASATAAASLKAACVAVRASPAARVNASIPPKELRMAIQAQAASSPMAVRMVTMLYSES